MMPADPAKHPVKTADYIVACTLAVLAESKKHRICDVAQTVGGTVGVREIIIDIQRMPDQPVEKVTLRHRQKLRRIDNAFIHTVLGDSTVYDLAVDIEKITRLSGDRTVVQRDMKYP